MARPRVKGPMGLNANGEIARAGCPPLACNTCVGVMEIPFSPTPFTGPGPGPSPHVIPLTLSGPKAR